MQQVTKGQQDRGFQQIYLYKKLSMNINRQSLLSQYIAKDLISKSIVKIQKMIQTTPLMVSLNEQSQSQPSQQFHKSQEKITHRIGQKTPDHKPSNNNYSHTSRNDDNKSIRSNSKVVKQTQKQLSSKAEDFVNRLKLQRNQLEGKIYLMKQAENKRKREAQRKLEIEKQVEAEIKKKIRKINAQKNIQYFNQKRKLYLNQESLAKSRSHSAATKDSKFEKIVLPSIHENQLQSIKEQEQDNIPDGLKKTVVRNKQKKRSKTQANMREKSVIYSPPKQLRQSNHYLNQKQIDDRRNSYKQYIKLKEDRYNQDKKCYLMSKDFNAEQISQYLQKYEDINKLETPKKPWVDKIRGKGKQKMKNRYKTRSDFNFEEQEEIYQSQYQKDVTQRKFN